ARLPESMTSPEMRDTKAYKTYLGYATGVTPPKKARKFKKLAFPKLMIVSASPKEPIRSQRELRDLPRRSVVKPRVPDVSKADSSKSDNESWGDSKDDNESDDKNDEGSENDNDDGNDAQDSEKD
nr:hypothetical protein [Tanacetum cinerariifolium]